MNTIVLTGGGTAGHVMAHVAILDKLKQSFDRVCYIGSDAIEKSIIGDVTEFFVIPTVKYKRKFDLSNLFIPIKLKKSVSAAKEILQKLEPKVIFSKGGYVSLPTMLAAKSLKIPIVTHESDFSLGLTNKLMAKNCDMVLTTFEETSQKVKNGVFVGSPVRQCLFNKSKSQALKYFGFNSDLPVLLVMGGSSGSKKLNNALKGALTDLLGDFQVLHICGKGNMSKCEYDKNYKQIEYLKEMEYAFAACDICVSRAGSNTCSELMALKIPTLFIPLSKAVSRGDQIENAQYFFKRKMCRVLEEEKLSPQSLVASVKQLYNNKEGIISAINHYKHTYANDTIVKILNQYISKY